MSHVDFGGKNFQAEGMSEKALRWEHPGHVRGTAKRPIWVKPSEQGGE